MNLLMIQQGYTGAGCPER